LVAQEPAGAAAFLAAYARGDEAGAEALASPLYRAEWARLGLSIAERAALRPWARPGAGSPPARLDFTFAGGVAAGGGFVHLLYAARGAAGAGPPALSAWRADADPGGRIVWLELVWLFSDAVAEPVPAGPADAVPDRGLPPAVAALRPVVLAGVRSAGGPEGYYALGVPTAAGPVAPIGFVAVDAAGASGPGAWTYGRPRGPAESGAARGRGPVALAPDLRALQRAYLGTLRCVC
jgi:hypothetical protein